MSFKIKEKIHTKVVLDVPMWGGWKLFCLGKQIISLWGGVCLGGLEVGGNMRKVKLGERVWKWIFIQRQGKLEKETCLLHTWIAGWCSVVIVVYKKKISCVTILIAIKVTCFNQSVNQLSYFPCKCKVTYFLVN